MLTNPFVPNTGCMCEPEFSRGYRFNAFFAEWFGMCLYTPQDLIGNAIGMLNLINITLIQIPQVVYNFKRKDCTEMSLFMLLMWNTGDICGLLSLILTGQIKSTNFLQQLYTTSVDLTLTVQFFLYQKKRDPAEEFADLQALSINTDNTNAIESLSLNQPLLPDGESSSGFSPALSPTPSQSPLRLESPTRLPLIQTHSPPQQTQQLQPRNSSNKLSSQTNILIIAVVVCIMSIQCASALSPILARHPGLKEFISSSTQHTYLNTSLSPPTIPPPPIPCESDGEPSAFAKIVGPILGWIMAAIYTVSQYPQVIANYRNKSGEAMSAAGLILTLVAYKLWYLSMFLPTKAIDTHHYGKDFFLNIFPFVFSYFFCMTNCWIMLFQRYYYRRKHRLEALKRQLEEQRESDGGINGTPEPPLHSNSLETPLLADSHQFHHFP